MTCLSPVLCLSALLVLFGAAVAVGLALALGLWLWARRALADWVHRATGVPAPASALLWPRPAPPETLPRRAVAPGAGHRRSGLLLPTRPASTKLGALGPGNIV